MLRIAPYILILTGILGGNGIVCLPCLVASEDHSCLATHLSGATDGEHHDAVLGDEGGRGPAPRENHRHYCPGDEDHDLLVSLLIGFFDKPQHERLGHVPHGAPLWFINRSLHDALKGIELPGWPNNRATITPAQPLFIQNAQLLI